MPPEIEQTPSNTTSNTSNAGGGAPKERPPVYVREGDTIWLGPPDRAAIRYPILRLHEDLDDNQRVVYGDVAVGALNACAGLPLQALRTRAVGDLLDAISPILQWLNWFVGRGERLGNLDMSLPVRATELLGLLKNGTIPRLHPPPADRDALCLTVGCTGCAECGTIADLIRPAPAAPPERGDGRAFAALTDEEAGRPLADWDDADLGRKVKEIGAYIAAGEGGDGAGGGAYTVGAIFTGVGLIFAALRDTDSPDLHIAAGEWLLIARRGEEAQGPPPAPSRPRSRRIPASGRGAGGRVD